MAKIATMEQAQAACRKLRSLGTPKAYAMADNIEKKWKNHPNYMSDQTWITHVQSGRQKH